MAFAPHKLRCVHVVFVLLAIIATCKYVVHSTTLAPSQAHLSPCPQGKHCTLSQQMPLAEASVSVVCWQLSNSHHISQE